MKPPSLAATYTMSLRTEMNLTANALPACLPACQPSSQPCHSLPQLFVFSPTHFKLTTCHWQHSPLLGLGGGSHLQSLCSPFAALLQP